MKSYCNEHKPYNSNSFKYYKPNKLRRHNVMKTTIPKDRMPTQNNAYVRRNLTIKRKVNFHFRITENNIRLNTYCPKDLTPNHACKNIPEAAEHKLSNTEIMTLLPYKNINQNTYNTVEPDNSALLARLTMNALAASETEINVVLDLVQAMYNSIQHMLQNVIQKRPTLKPSQTTVQAVQPVYEPKYMIHIDLKRFTKYFNGQYLENRQKQRYLEPPNIKCQSFNILIQPRRLSFNLSVCKFNSCSSDFFQRLATFYNSFNKTHCTIKRNPVPSVFIRDWHFRNVSQGYVLSALLKNNNVMSLNVMRKLYFVIITSVTPNLTIEINLKLAHGIFMVYDNPSLETKPFDIIHWNDKHRNVLESCSNIMYTPNALLALTYSIPSDNVNSQTPKTNSDILLDNASSSDSTSTLKYESTTEYELSEYIRSSFSEFGFDLKSTESSLNLTLRNSVKTVTLSIDESLSHCDIDRQDCGDMKFENQERNSLDESRIRRNTIWIGTFCKASTKFKTEIVVPYLNSLMNESVFDRVTDSMNEQMSSCTQYWTLFDSKTLCKTFLKDFGCYLANTLLIPLTL